MASLGSMIRGFARGLSGTQDLINNYANMKNEQNQISQLDQSVGDLAKRMQPYENSQDPYIRSLVAQATPLGNQYTQSQNYAEKKAAFDKASELANQIERSQFLRQSSYGDISSQAGQLGLTVGQKGKETALMNNAGQYVATGSPEDIRNYLMSLSGNDTSLTDFYSNAAKGRGEANKLAMENANKVADRQAKLAVANIAAQASTNKPFINIDPSRGIFARHVTDPVTGRGRYELQQGTTSEGIKNLPLPADNPPSGVTAINTSPLMPYQANGGVFD